MASPKASSPCSPSEEEEEAEGKKVKKAAGPQGRKGRAETSSEEGSASESSSSGSDSGTEAPAVVEAKRRKAVRAGLGGRPGGPQPPCSSLPISLPLFSPPAAGPAPRRSPCSTWMTVSGHRRHGMVTVLALGKLRHRHLGWGGTRLCGVFG